MPVGTSISLAFGGESCSATVIRVREAVKGRSDSPGVWVQLAEAIPEAAREQWAAARSAEDPSFPEGAPSSQAAARSPATVVSGPPESMPTQADEPVPEESAPEIVDDGRKTQVMDAAEIQAAVARETAVAGDEDGDSASAPKGKKRRKRRRRKTRT